MKVDLSDRVNMDDQTLVFVYIFIYIYLGPVCEDRPSSDLMTKSGSGAPAY